MTPTDLLGSLRAVELRLSTSEISQFIRQQPDALRDAFVHWSLQLSIVISRLETADLWQIAGKLQENEAALTAGITQIQKEIIMLQRADRLVTTLASVLTTVLAILTLV